MCVFSLGRPPRNTYHSDTGSAETSRIPSYENKHHGNIERGEERRGEERRGEERRGEERRGEEETKAGIEQNWR